MINVVKEIALQMLEEMPYQRKVALDKALGRNYLLTSVYTMEWGEMYIYKQGFYLVLEGTRSKFAVWAYDVDGEYEFGRKPPESKLCFIYKTGIHFSEDDFDFIKKEVQGHL